MRELEAIYHEVEGSVALKSDQPDIGLAIKELEYSVKLFFESRCYFRLAQAYLARAQSEVCDWKQWISKARESCESADAADARSRYTNELEALRVRLDALEQEKQRSAASA